MEHEVFSVANRQPVTSEYLPCDAMFGRNLVSSKAVSVRQAQLNESALKYISAVTKILTLTYSARTENSALHFILLKRLSIAVILFSGVLTTVAQNPTPPPEQVKWCALKGEWETAVGKYRRLDAFAQQSAKPPKDEDYFQQAHDILGDSGAFTNWVGVLQVKTSDQNGMASLTLLPCVGTIFGTAQTSTSQTQTYEGAGLLPFSDKIVAALIAIPKHGSSAVVTGHLFLAQPHHPKEPPYAFISWTGDGSFPRVSDYRTGSFISFGPYLATFKRVALPRVMPPTK